MTNATRELIKVALRNDATVTPQDRVKILAALNGNGEKPEAKPTTTGKRILRRKDAALMLSRSVRTIDNLAKAGILERIQFPGHTQSAGITAASLERLLIANGNHHAAVTKEA